MDGTFAHVDYSDPTTFHVTLSGDLDASCHERIDQLVQSFERGRHPNVVLDLRAVPEADVTCLNAFIPLRRISADRGGSLTLVGMSESVWLTLSMTGLAQGPGLRGTRMDALRGWRARIRSRWAARRRSKRRRPRRAARFVTGRR